jgi:hypothetical protein
MQLFRDASPQVVLGGGPVPVVLGDTHPEQLTFAPSRSGPRVPPRLSEAIRFLTLLLGIGAPLVGVGGQRGLSQSAPRKSRAPRPPGQST